MESVENSDKIMFENVGVNKNHNVKVTYMDIVQINGTVPKKPQKSTLNFVVGTKIETVGTPGTVSLGKK